MYVRYYYSKARTNSFLSLMKLKYMDKWEIKALMLYLSYRTRYTYMIVYYNSFSLEIIALTPSYISWTSCASDLPSLLLLEMS